MNLFKITSLCTLVLLLMGCGSEYYKMSYHAASGPVMGANVLPLAPGDKPRLIFIKNIDEEIENYNTEFAILGQSDFNGPIEDTEKARKLAKEVGATHVLMSSKYLYVSTKKAHKYVDNFIYFPRYSNPNGYLERTYDRVPDPIAIPYTKEISIYKQRAVYMVKLK